MIELLLGLGSVGSLAALFGGYVLVRPRLVRRAKVASEAAIEEVSFFSPDGTRLRGWFLPSHGAQRALILCHGWLRNRNETFPLALQLNRRGYHVLVFDFRGCGQSQGLFPTFGYREVADLLSAVSYLRRRPDTRDAALGTLGISMGGAVALMAAAQCPELEAVVADSAYASLDRTWMPVPDRLRAVLVPLVERISRIPLRTIRPMEAARALVACPTFFIHGRRDWLVPPRNSELLCAVAAGPTELWLVEDAAHGMARFTRPAEYLDRVDAFFRRHLHDRVGRRLDSVSAAKSEGPV